MSDLVHSQEIATKLPKPQLPDTKMSFLPVIDMDWLVAQPLMKYIVKTAPPHLLYRSLMATGLEDSIEVLECLTGRQLERILDFDLWGKNPQTLAIEISSSRALQWLRLWSEISYDFAAKRMAELEEETVLEFHTSLLHIVPRGIAYSKDDDYPDDCFLTPDGMFEVKPRDNSAESFEILHQYILHLYGADPKTANSILAHAAMQVRSEFQEDSERFRKGRLADQGFVSRDDALSTLRLRSSAAVLLQIKSETNSKNPATQRHETFGAFELDPDVIDDIVTELTLQEPEQTFLDVKLALSASKFLELVGDLASHPKEAFEDEEEMIDKGSRAIANHCQRLLDSVMTMPMHTDQSDLKIVSAMKLISEFEPQLVSDLLARLSRLSNVVMSVWSNTFEAEVARSSLEHVRGFVNLGLEHILEQPVHEFNWSYRPSLVSLPEHEQLLISVLLDSGLENIFHLGLSLANEIKAKAKTCMKYLDLSESDKHILDAFTSVLPLFPDILFSTDLNVGSRTVSSWSHCNQVLAANSFLDMKQQMEAIHVKN